MYVATRCTLVICVETDKDVAIIPDAYALAVQFVGGVVLTDAFVAVFLGSVPDGANICEIQMIPDFFPNFLFDNRNFIDETYDFDASVFVCDLAHFR